MSTKPDKKTNEITKAALIAEYERVRAQMNAQRTPESREAVVQASARLSEFLVANDMQPTSRDKSMLEDVERRFRYDLAKQMEKEKDVAALKDLATRAQPKELFHLEGMIERRGGDPGPRHCKCGELAMPESRTLWECTGCYERGYGK